MMGAVSGITLDLPIHLHCARISLRQERFGIQSGGSAAIGDVLAQSLPAIRVSRRLVPIRSIVKRYQAQL